MEDGNINSTGVPAMLDVRVLLTKMANYPDVEVTVIKGKKTTDCKNSESATKINGESEKIHSDEQDEYTSDEDTLIIDEEFKKKDTQSSATKKRVRSPSPRANFKGFKKRIIEKSLYYVQLTNDIKKKFFIDDEEKAVGQDKRDKYGESCTQGEFNKQETITQTIKTDINNKQGTDESCTLKNQNSKFSHKSLGDASNRTDSLKHNKVSVKQPVKKRPSQKLTEYAQYLGLQPAVKFKCVKCSESSFPSLSALNDHQRHCLVQPSAAKSTPATTTSSSTVPSSSTPLSTNFRVTRKVFLCSSCGTYYENCNLFLHMREVHRRYICLYCLGMFSLPEKLSLHLVAKHNCSPSRYTSAEDFLNSYMEPCFLVCCHCDRVFSEQENFFDHVCLEKSNATATATATEKSCWSCGVRGTTAHLVSCKAEQPSTSSNNTPKISNKSSAQKSLLKLNKPVKNNSKLATSHVQHVTADSPSTSVALETEMEHEPSETKLNIRETKSPIETIESEKPVSNSPLTLESNTTNIKTEDTSAMIISSPKTEITSPEIPLVEITENSQKEVPDLEETENSMKIDDPKLATEPMESSPILQVKTENEDIPEKIEENTSIEENNLPADSDHSSVDLIEPNAEENHSDVEQTEENMEKNNVDSHDSNVSESNWESENVKDTSSVHSVHDSDDDDIVKNEFPDSKESDNEDEPVKQAVEPVEETRKVPKVTLKLPPPGSIVYNSENETDDSEKLTMEVEENGDSDVDCEESQDNNSKPQTETEENHVNGIGNNDAEHTDDSDSQDEFAVAGNEVPIVELELDLPLDKFDSKELLKTCLGATISTCVYCNHARKIAVNGKQLGLHSIAEHRFAATVNSITAEELIPKSFNSRIKECLDELDSVFFSLDEKIKLEDDIKEEDSTITSFKRVYECFQCRYVTTIHKELYLHNRKMHAKTILLCIMCKSNFYSYSELICHLCPGNYVLNSETRFRCCMCSFNELPSAFRLMVHLRKRHHTCDVCLEGCNNQSKLSNHVWKHKLHHLCYRCGIAYRNKPDITKHLFWKHGTESVLCKRCLQKKWPHVYHFCIPPVSFLCEECNLSFSKAVYLKVHKRLHINEKPHACTEENCSEMFISKKLQLKHELRHREPIPIEKSDSADENKENIEVEKVDNPDSTSTSNDNPPAETVKLETTEKNPSGIEKEEPNSKKIIDVYDLPALNLSESDSDDSEEEKSKSAPVTPQVENKDNDVVDSLTKSETAMEVEITKDEDHKPIPILDGIWDNFKSYQATIGKTDTISSTDLTNADNINETFVKEEAKVEVLLPDIDVIMAEHDYCASQNPDTETDNKVDVKAEENTGMDHDYCTVSTKENTTDSKEPKEEKPQIDNIEKKKNKSSKKKASKHNGSSSSSDSSSDSGSSSCTCGSNCSCSSSSGSSSSSSTSSDSDTSSSEGKRRILARRERRKERANKRKKESETSQTSAVDVVATEDQQVPVPIPELPILESDLDTDETETDEDFYDEHPQRLANKILAEKRNQLALLAAVAPVNNGSILECSRPTTPTMPEPEQHVVKKKVKSKKRKKKSRSSTPKHSIPPYNRHHHHQPTIMQPVLPATPVYQPTVPPINIINSVVTTRVPETPKQHLQSNTGGSGSETDSNVRSSKRRRVPNKFYGYSSDEEREKLRAIPPLKWRKADLPSVPSSHVTGSPKMVPPLTIKNIPSPAPVIEPIRAPVVHHSEVPESDSDVEEVVQNPKSTSDSSESNHNNDESDSDTGQLHISQPPVYHHPPPIPQHSAMMQGQRSNENLYCYCQCPYDEVSEMIACDGKDCAIEWFHFECVGIMVPPKGKWFCPDCRKKATGRSDFIQI